MPWQQAGFRVKLGPATHKTDVPRKPWVLASMATQAGQRCRHHRRYDQRHALDGGHVLIMGQQPLVVKAHHRGRRVANDSAVALGELSVNTADGKLYFQAQNLSGAEQHSSNVTTRSADAMPSSLPRVLPKMDPDGA